MAKKNYVTRSDFLAIEPEIFEMEIGEKTFRLRELSALEMAELTNRKLDWMAFRVELLAVALVDENGEKLLTADDVAAIGAKNYRLIKELSDQAMAMNQRDAGAILAAMENFE